MLDEILDRSWIADTDPVRHACFKCGRTFCGGPARIVCRDCAAPEPKPVEPAEPLALMAVLRPVSGEDPALFVQRVQAVLEANFNCVYVGRIALYAQMGDAPKPPHTEPGYDAPERP